MTINSELSKFPNNPDDQQSFVDDKGGIWIYDQQAKSWEFSGPRLNVNLADSNTTGLLSPQHKLLLDTISQFPGAFGIVVDKPYKQIVQGDVTLTSSTLDISCLSAGGTILNAASGCGEEIRVSCTDSDSSTNTIPRFEIKLNDNYLNNLCIDLPAPSGQDGKPGKPGAAGPDGFGDGPRGTTGESGPDVTELLELGRIIYEDSAQIASSAIVDIKLVDQQRGASFKMLKSERTLASGEEAARLSVTPVTRTIVYNTKLTDKCIKDGLGGWQISKTSGDPLPTVPFLLRGSDDNNQDSSAVATVSLEQYVQGLVDLYEQKIVALDKQWSALAKRHIEAIDSKARSILSNLADDLTRCESTLAGTEFGITFERCASSPVTPTKLSRAAGANVGSVSASGEQWDIIL